jgi:DHA1 family tetracycline resistance protein-like MFS transporter
MAFLTRLKRIKGPLAIITVSMFLNSVGFTIIIPVVPFLIGRYVDASQIGLVVGIITAAYALCQFVAAPVLGAISDHRGRRSVLLLSLLGSVAGYIVFGIGGALWVLFLGRIIDGFTGGNISTMFAYVADITPPQERGRAYGLLGAAGGFGFMMGPAIGGLAGAISLSLPVFVAAAVTFGNVLWAYFALPESLPPTKRAHGFGWAQLNPFAPFAHVFNSATLRIAFAASFGFFFAATMMQSNLSVYLKDVLAFGPVGIGAVLFTVGVMDIVSQGVLTGRLLPRYGERNLARSGLFINAVGFLLIGLVAFVPTVVLIFAAIIVFTLGDGLFQPSISGIIANAAPAAAQGRVQGANQGQQSIARILGPLLAAFLYTIDVSGPYFAGAAIILVALGFLFV